MATKSKPDIRRKNFRLDQRKLNRAREILGARTETETIEQALDLIVFQREVRDGLRRVAGTGGVRNVFEDDEEPAG